MHSVGIALVGSGLALRRHLPALALVPGAAVRILVGRDAQRTSDLARRHGIPASTARLEEALGRQDVELVCVATPTDLHRETCEAALGAGKHVLCEVPMGLTAAQSESMVRAARASQRLAVVDHHLRFEPTLRKMRRLIGEGYVGAPLHAHATMLHPRWIDPHRPHSWWHESRRGGGILGVCGSHAIDWLRWTFGEVAAVTGELHTFVRERTPEGELHPKQADADEFAAIHLRVGRGVQATILLSAVAHRGPALRLEVFGTEGMLRFDSEGRLWGSRCESGVGAGDPPLEELSESEDLGREARRAVPDSPSARAFVHFAQALVGAVRSGAPTVPEAARFDDGLAVQEVLDAVRASAAAGRRMAPSGPG